MKETMATEKRVCINPDKLKVYLGGGIGDEASFDRLFEMIGGKAYKIDGESYRRRHK